MKRIISVLLTVILIAIFVTAGNAQQLQTTTSKYFALPGLSVTGKGPVTRLFFYWDGEIPQSKRERPYGVLGAFYQHIEGQYKLVWNPYTTGSEYVFAGQWYDHSFLGVLLFPGWKFDGDNNYPLHIRLVENKGVLYLCGRGIVTTKDGKTFRFGYEDTVDNWLPLLKSTDELDRQGAAQALGWLTKSKEQNNKVIPALIKALKDPIMEVRRSAVESLGNIGDDRAAETLNLMLKDKDEWVRGAAEEAMKKIRHTTVK